LKFAAIDIGSNAVRLLFCNVFEGNGSPVFKKAELIRVPLRLGEDSFLRGSISEKKADKLVTAMKAFRHLIKVYDAIDYRACATSAMRDASNGPEIVERIRLEAGLTIEIIDGKTEADIIYSNHIAEHLDKDRAYLYIDIGGGSTELSVFWKGVVVASRSFNIGTIRMLHEQVTKDTWNEMKSWVAAKTESYKEMVAIGSGGNINKLFKMSHKKQHKPLSYDRLKDLYERLSSYTMEERITLLGLNPDRADVIMPASRIVLTVMKTAGIEKMLVPQIGLSDGIVHLLYEEHKAKQKKHELAEKIRN
jgi:exopolyphosphatase / guanosine-5'-triphosphate,3'-diphosphate pyrophosphatase